MARRATGLSAAIHPQPNIFGEELHQPVQFARAGGLYELVEKLAMRFLAGFEARAMLGDVLLRATSQLTAGCFFPANHPGDLGILVVEDFTQQEDGPFKWR